MCKTTGRRLLCMAFIGRLEDSVISTKQCRECGGVVISWFLDDDVPSKVVSSRVHASSKVLHSIKPCALTLTSGLAALSFPCF